MIEINKYHLLLSIPFIIALTYQIYTFNINNPKSCHAMFKKNNLTGEFIVSLTMPFSILYLEKKIISLLARYEFNKRSLTNLHDYTIDKNERKIKKKNLELHLTEREINFLILFSQSDKPVTRNFILKNVWNYSSGTDTHTVETHIHRLRKKILQKLQLSC